MKTNGKTRSLHDRAVDDINRELRRSRANRKEFILLGVITVCILVLGCLLIYFGPDFMEWLDRQDPVKTAIGSIIASAVFGALIFARNYIKRINWLRLVVFVGILVISYVVWHFIFRLI